MSEPVPGECATAECCVPSQDCCCLPHKAATAGCPALAGWASASCPAAAGSRLAIHHQDLEVVLLLTKQGCVGPTGSIAPASAFENWVGIPPEQRCIDNISNYNYNHYSCFKKIQKKWEKKIKYDQKLGLKSWKPPEKIVPFSHWSMKGIQWPMSEEIKQIVRKIMALSDWPFD